MKTNKTKDTHGIVDADPGLDPERWLQNRLGYICKILRDGKHYFFVKKETRIPTKHGLYNANAVQEWEEAREILRSLIELIRTIRQELQKNEGIK